MRILFLADPGPDYLQDVAFHGLASLLPRGDVVEYPPLERYHSAPPAGTAYPQLWFEFPRPERLPFRDAVAAADAVVVGSLRSGIRAHVGELLDLRRRPPVVHLDGEDDFYVRGVRSRVEVYCKREILLSAGRH